MIKQFLVLSLLAFSINGNAQEISEMNALLDSVISSAKESSYYSTEVNWDSLTVEMHNLAIDPVDVYDLKPAFTLMLNELRDHHGRIMSTSDYSTIANFTDRDIQRHADDREFDSETWAIVNNLESRFQYALLPGGIGYLKIVAVAGNVDGQLESERIRAGVCELKKAKVKEWIVDLRYNGGGNINVMLAGIAPLLNTETVASIQDESNEIRFTAEVKKGNFWYAGNNVFKMKKGPKLKDPKIAVLTSRWTVSSGELVAVAFKGQENVQFFGEATGGYTTNTGWQVFDNKIALVIATGVYCDRNGVSYDINVRPDVEIEFVVENDRSKDEGILQASDWLKE